jgi:exonuclease VII small subunit
LRRYATAGEKALKELEKSVRAMERGMASLEVELKSQRKDIAKVMTTVDRMAAAAAAARK